MARIFFLLLFEFYTKSSYGYTSTVKKWRHTLRTHYTEVFIVTYGTGCTLDIADSHCRSRSWCKKVQIEPGSPTWVYSINLNILKLSRRKECALFFYHVIVHPVFCYKPAGVWASLTWQQTFCECLVNDACPNFHTKKCQWTLMAVFRLHAH